MNNKIILFLFISAISTYSIGMMRSTVFLPEDTVIIGLNTETTPQGIKAVLRENTDTESIPQSIKNFSRKYRKYFSKLWKIFRKKYKFSQWAGYLHR